MRSQLTQAAPSPLMREAVNTEKATMQNSHAYKISGGNGPIILTGTAALHSTQISLIPKNNKKTDVGLLACNRRFYSTYFHCAKATKMLCKSNQDAEQKQQRC